MQAPEHHDDISLLIEQLNIHTTSDLEELKQEAEHCLSIATAMLEAIESGSPISEEDARTMISFFSKISNASLAASTEILLNLHRR